MRKNFNGLCGLVENDLLNNPTDGNVYISINKAKDKVKLLHWKSGGFIVYYKRLEQGRFELPVYDDQIGSIGLYCL